MLLSKLIALDTVDSTNNYIANLLKTDDIAHGTVILSYNQQNGRGQRGTEWTGEPYKNIAFSIYLEHSHKTINDAHFLSYAISLAVKDFLLSYKIDAKVKWPNDLLVENKKIAGVLIENQVSSINLNSSIVGIGINVNQVFPSNLPFSVTSMTKLLNRELNLEALSLTLVDCIEKRYEQFIKGDYLSLAKEFAENMWKKGEWLTAEIEGVQQKVKIEGTDENGYLVLNVNGEKRSFDIKEVKFVY